jgi:hypothetical protein
MTFEEVDYGIPFAFAYGGGWVVAYKVEENKAQLLDGRDVFLAPETEVILDEEDGEEHQKPLPLW